MNRRKGITTAWIISLLTLWCFSAPAQDQPAQKEEQKIGFINLETIELEWIEYQTLKFNLDTLFRIDEKDLNDMRQDILQRERALKKRRGEGAISEEEYQNLHQMLLMESKRVGIYAEVRARLVKRKVDQKLDRATRIVEDVVKTIGEEEGFDMILNDAGFLGVNPKLDISDKVKDALNEQTYGL